MTWRSLLPLSLRPIHLHSPFGVSTRPRRSPGQVLVLVALGMVPLLGAVGVSIDVGQIFMRYRQVQTAADAGALAGTRNMASGVPGVDVTSATVTTAITTYVTANVPAATIASAKLLKGTGGSTRNAYDCIVNRDTSSDVNVSSASTNDLWTADCLQVISRNTFNTYFVQIVGISTFTVTATSTASATPVTAMGGIRPITIPDSYANATGTTVTPWGPNWATDTVLGSKTCAQWTAALVPHPQSPDPPCSPGTISISSSYKGMVNLMGPPSPPNEYTSNSSASGCHWHMHNSGTDNQDIGWSNPVRPAHSGSYTVTHHGTTSPLGWWDNLQYRIDPAYNNCNNSASFHGAIERFAEFGYDGVISAGAASAAKGDFFTLNNGNLGDNFSGPLDDACDAFGTQMTIFIPLFDAFADPNHSGQGGTPSRPPVVHISSFAALRILCSDIGGSSVAGTLVQGNVPPDEVMGSGGIREVGKPNLTVIKLVQ
ncbi:MAG: Tad protein [Chloroflexi bacterium]|nr:Tad protein [Chloroflexota bacterium]